MTTVAMRPERLVELALHGDAGDHVLEGERAALFGEDRNVVRIPLGEDVALGDLLAVADVEEGADHDVVVLELLALVVEDLDRAGLVEDDVAALGRLAPGAGRGTCTLPAERTRISGVLKPPEATPPMWNVRIVSCVPGSPIDWAAMMPTESPILAMRLVAGLMP